MRLAGAGAGSGRGGAAPGALADDQRAQPHRVNSLTVGGALPRARMVEKGDDGAIMSSRYSRGRRCPQRRWGRAARLALSCGGRGSAEDHLVDAEPIQRGADDEAEPEIPEGRIAPLARADAIVAVTYAITVRTHHSFLPPRHVEAFSQEFRTISRGKLGGGGGAFAYRCDGFRGRHHG